MIWYTDSKANESCKKSLKLKLPSPPTPIKPAKEPEQKSKKVSATFKDLLKAYWQKYCENSTIHGVRYIYDPTLRGIERLIWTALVITCVTLTCIAYFMLTERYSAMKLQTVVQNSQYPVFQIPFPAVGICTQNRINWQKFEQANATFLPPSADKATVKVFADFVQRMNSLSFGNFGDFNDMEDIDLQLIDSIDVTKLAKFMALRCEDILVNGSCYWRGMPFECCSRFVLEHTEYGYCLVFNSELSPESWNIQNNLGRQFYPYHNSKAGQRTGLNVRIKVDSKLVSPFAKPENSILVLIKRNDQLTDVGYTITPKTITYFIVRPQITESDVDLHLIEPVKRNCYFEDEFFLLARQSNMTNKCRLNNCVNRCHEDHVRNYCNCTLPSFILFPDETLKQCQPSKFRCLAKHNDIFSYDKRKEEDAYFSASKPGMTCSCLVPCNVVEYFTSLTTLPLCDQVVNDTSIEIYDVDVHYQSEVLIQYRTSLEFTGIDLIANFGGIFGLCLGASLVSAVELLYYGTIGFGLYLYDNEYFTLFKANLQRLKHKWTIELKNSFKDDNEVCRVMETSSRLKHHPMRKTNRW